MVHEWYGIKGGLTSWIRCFSLRVWAKFVNCTAQEHVGNTQPHKNTTPPTRFFERDFFAPFISSTTRIVSIRTENDKSSKNNKNYKNNTRTTTKQ